MFLLGPDADPVLSASDPVRAAGCPCASRCASAVHGPERARPARLCCRVRPAVLP